MSSVMLSPKLKVTVQADFETVVNRLRRVLKGGGFEVMIEANVQDLIGGKAEFPLLPHRVFGVYNPDLVHRAFVVSHESSLLLPYNVTAALVGDHLVEVSSLDPRVLLDVIGSPYLKPVAEELFQSLARVMEAMNT